MPEMFAEFNAIFEVPTVDLITKLSPRKFGEFIAYLFNRDKLYRAVIVDGRDDGGVDIELRSRDASNPVIMGVAQCKRFQVERIGPNYIREFAAAKQSSKVENGYFFTTSTYTPAAYKDARIYGIFLYDPPLIQRWIRDIHQREVTDGIEVVAVNPHHIAVPTICIANNKGGVGKTAVSVNLAAALADDGDVLVIDADPQADATFWLTGQTDIDPALSLYAILTGKDKARPLIRKTSAQGVWLLPGSTALNDIPKGLNEFEWETKIARALLQFPITDPPIKYVIIDSPPALNSLACSALIASRYLLIPFRLDNFSKEGARHFIEFVKRQEARHAIPPLQFLGGVANFVTQTRIARTFSGEIANSVLSFPQMADSGMTRDKFWRAHIRQREDFLTALSQQIPVTALRRSEAADDIRSLATEVKGRVGSNTNRSGQ